MLQSLLEQLLRLLEQGRETAPVLALLESFVHLGGKQQVAAQLHRVAQAMGPKLQTLLTHLSQQPADPPGAACWLPGRLAPRVQVQGLGCGVEGQPVLQLPCCPACAQGGRMDSRMRVLQGTVLVGFSPQHGGPPAVRHCQLDSRS